MQTQHVGGGKKRLAILRNLTSPDVPYVQDAVRYAPKERTAFFDRMRKELNARKRRYVVLEGDWDARRARAIAAVEELVP